MNILVTGGAGYIGSHTVLELLEAGHKVWVIDNLSNSSEESIHRVEQITGKKISFFEGDIRREEDLDQVMDREHFEVVIHFAGLKSVGESVQDPIRYYDNNITGTLTLLKCMLKHQVYNIIFSSSATVYGEPETVPIKESVPKGKCTNPYGWSKSMLEQILTDLCVANKKMRVILLRYFNPIGAHESGLIGEDPKGIPNNLFPYITQTAIGKRKGLSIFGNDYDTKDGTGVRDYIHVVDLAKGHVAALKAIHGETGVEIYNLGTGVGYSVLDCVRTFEKVNGVKVPFMIAPRRSGDVPSCYADVEKARQELGWKAEKTLEDMCRVAWRWQQKNPNGYQKKTTLVILAAGLGSRYGGLKQLDPVGPTGEFIIDYSINDAIEAGFNKVVFIIKKENEMAFRETIGQRTEKRIETAYVFQEMTAGTDGLGIPADRTKPLGTAHALLCAKEEAGDAFAVINADDYYGPAAFEELHRFLVSDRERKDFTYCMVGFMAANTLTENGTVSRGVCSVSENHELEKVTEMTKLKRDKDGVIRNHEDPDHIQEIPDNAIVSMNCWGFNGDIFHSIQKRFSDFVNSHRNNLLKAEYYLPEVVAEDIQDGIARVKVMTSKDQWFGVTYHEDKETVMKALSYRSLGLHGQTTRE